MEIYFHTGSPFVNIVESNEKKSDDKKMVQIENGVMVGSIRSQVSIASYEKCGGNNAILIFKSSKRMYMITPTQQEDK